MTPCPNCADLHPSLIHAQIHDAIDAEFLRAFRKHGGRTPRSDFVGDQRSLVVLVEAARSRDTSPKPPLPRTKEVPQ